MPAIVDFRPDLEGEGDALVEGRRRLRRWWRFHARQEGDIGQRAVLPNPVQLVGVQFLEFRGTEAAVFLGVLSTGPEQRVELLLRRLDGAPIVEPVEARPFGARQHRRRRQEPDLAEPPVRRNLGQLPVAGRRQGHRPADDRESGSGIGVKLA